MTTTKVLRVSANADLRINIYVDSEQVGFSQSPTDAVELLTYMGKPLQVAILTVNATLPKPLRLLCRYDQSVISCDTNKACIQCGHPKKKHPVG